jgi:hypothetical protein
MRKKKDFIEEIFDKLLKEDFKFGNMGGYSISIFQEGGRTKIYVKAGKNVDVYKLKKDLEEQYPGAEIYIEGKNIEEKPSKKLIEVIDERKIEEEK